MADITQTIPLVDEYSVTPSRNNPSTFFEDRETRLDEETTRIPQQNTQASALNTFATQANSLKSEVNTLRNTTVSKAAEALNSATSASNSATTASSAKTYIENYVIPTEATYSTSDIDKKINALAPYSGYTQVSKKLDNFVFQTSSNFLNKVADKNRYVKFGDKVVDTYGAELVTNGDFSDGTTGWTLTGGSTILIDGKLRLQGTTEPYAKTTITGLSIGKIYTVYVDCTIYQGAETNKFLDIRLYNNAETATATTISTYKTDTVKFTFVANDTTMKLRFRYANSVVSYYCDIDNISVKEIQTAQFTVPEVSEIITDGSNTTSVAVNAGDYVVDGSELVTSISGTTTDSKPVANNALVTGRSYIVTGDCSGLTTGTYAISLGGSIAEGINRFTVSSNGHFSKKLTLNNVPTQDIYVTVTDGFDGEVSNLSIRRVSDTFRAKQDAPIGTALTNTTYFEDRTQIGVTNQQLAYHAYNTLTNSYEGIKTETLFSDVSKEDLLDNPTWMARNGFSKVSDFLYSKGSYLVLPVGIWQSLNKGAYHPMLNPFGTCFLGEVGETTYFWYHSSQADITNIGVLFSQDLYNKTASARPDSKFYDIVYPDQFIDVREYAKILNQYEVDLIRDDKEDNGVEEIIFTEQVLQTTTGTVDTLEVSDGTKYRVGSVLQIWNGTTGYRRYVASVSGNTVTLDSTIDKTAVQFIIGGGRLPILSSGTSLSIDLIGAPNA